MLTLKKKSSLLPIRTKALYVVIAPQPLMDCAICFKAFEDQIQDEPNPYVHCIQRPRLTEVILLMCLKIFFFFLHFILFAA